MEKIKIYFSSGMDTIHEMKPIAEKLLNKFTNQIEIYFPRNIDCYENLYVWTDIKKLIESDILIYYIPKPTIGAASEVALFAYNKPHNISIGYRSINHGWLLELTKYRTNSEEVIYEIVDNYLETLKMM